MCDIPDIETTFYEGMPPDVIRYRNLDDENIKGLPNDWMRAFLHAHLLAGIKIVKTTKETYQLLSADEYRERVFRLNNELITKSEEVDSKDKQITVLNQEKEQAIQAAKSECAQEASALQQRIREIENQVNVVNQQLKDKIAECEKTHKESEKDKQEIHDLKVKAEELEQKLADERRRAINEKDEINKLKKQLEDNAKS